jgi:hypothetical protein
MSAARSILLVGSIPLSDAEAVFCTLGDRLGDRAPRYPDGETGVRTNWIRWQRHIFEDNDAFELYRPAANLAGIKDDLSRPFYQLKPGVDDQAIDYKALGFAAEAIKSYAVFSRLKRDGRVPAATRFQVSLPTVVAILSGFVVMADRARAEPALETAMARELQAIGRAIPGDELAVQWDVCLELVGYDGGYALHLQDILPDSVARIARQIAMVPAGAEVGIHLCYGDPGHKHIVEPKDASSMVAFANAIVAASPRPIAYIHLPIPRQWDDAGFYAPLAKLKTPPGTAVYLGLVHASDGKAGAERRAALARPFVKDFGIATECGFGRREPSTVPPLLDLHAQLAATA